MQEMILYEIGRFCAYHWSKLDISASSAFGLSVDWICITFWSYFDTYSAIQWEDTVREIYCEVYFDQIHSWSSAIHLWCTISINSQLWEGCAGTYKDISGTQRGAEWKHLRYIRRLQESKKVWRRAGVVDCKNNPRCWCSYHGLEVAQEECG